MQNKLKILVIGPTESGKTTLANFLSESVEIGNYGGYRPTKGCRIVEFEVPNVRGSASSMTVEVEMWDVSGDWRYSSCWPAIQRRANGIVFVCNPGKEDHPRILDSLHSHFVSQQGIKDSQCVVFCYVKSDSQGTASKLSSAFSQISQIDVDLEDGGRVRTDFAHFLSSVVMHMNDVAERQENFILQ